MRKNLGAKTCIYPMPILIIASYNEDKTADAMNAAWGGISEMNESSMCLSAGHKTVKNILREKDFTISLEDDAHIAECDYVADKVSKAGFTVTASELVNAPVINELPICLECRMKSYDENTCRLVGEIVNVSVDEKAMIGEK